MPRCPRCGDPFERFTVDQRYCRPCEREVAAIEAADARRRAPRFAAPKDMTTLTGVVL